MSWIAGRHHVLGVEHLLCELWDCQGSVLLASSGCQGSEPWHEEMETWEWHHVDCQFPEISIELTRESETGCHSGHSGGDEMVQIAVCWCGQFQRSEADVVQSLVVDTVGLICVLNKLMDRQGGVVGLNNRV